MSQALREWVWEGPAWSHHPQGKNFLAKIETDIESHTGFKRSWQPRAKGKLRGFVWRQMAPGDAFEIGSHDVNSVGVLVARRVYGVIVNIDNEVLDYTEYKSAREAIIASERAVIELPAERDAFAMIQRRARDVRQVIANAEKELSLIQQQIKEMAQDEGLPADAIIEDVLGVESAEPAVLAPIPDLIQTLQETAKARIAAPIAPSKDPVDEDDDEDELSPAQLAALSR